MVFDPAGPITERRFLHRRRAIARAHRCVQRRIQRDCRAIRMEEEKSSPAPVQKPSYHSALIPGTSPRWYLDRRPNRRFRAVGSEDGFCEVDERSHWATQRSEARVTKPAAKMLPFGAYFANRVIRSDQSLPLVVRMTTDRLNSLSSARPRRAEC